MRALALSLGLLCTGCVGTLEDVAASPARPRPRPEPSAAKRAAAAPRQPAPEDERRTAYVQTTVRFEPILLPGPRSGAFLGTGDVAYRGPRIDLVLKDADIRDVVQHLAGLLAVNVVIYPEVHGTVTVSLRDVPADQALLLVLKTYGLGAMVEGNVIEVASVAHLASR